MKKNFLVLLTLVMMFTTTLFAQTPRCSVKFATFYEGTTDPNLLSEGKSEYEMIFLGNKSMLTVSQQGITQGVIIDGDKQVQIITIETPTEGYFLELPLSEIKEKSKNLDYKYEYSEETKTIAGVVCKKVVLTLTNLETDEEDKLILYVTEEFSSLLNEFPNPMLNLQLSSLKGYPLRIEIPSVEAGEGVYLVIEAKEIIPSKKIKDVNFMISSELKNLRDYPDLMKQITGGGEDEE